jgi:vancomycin resistance protein YoaR
VQVDVAQREAQVAALRSRRRRQARNRRVRRLGLLAVLLVVGGAVITATVYAGSSGTLTSGETIAGVDVGGMTAQQAQQTLERRAAELASAPVVVHVAGHTFRLLQKDVGAQVDWAGAVASAKSKGDGFAFIRGFRRLIMRAFGSSVTPTATARGHGLDRELDAIVAHVGRAPREAALMLHGLHPQVVPGRVGLSINRALAKREILDRFAGLNREPVVLPLGVARPTVTAAKLAAPAAQLRTAVSAPIFLTIGSTRYRVPAWQVATLLKLPSGGASTITVGGKGADAYVLKLEKAINHAPKDATFAVSGSAVRIVPDQPGQILNVPATVASLLRAATSPTNRNAPLVVVTKPAKQSAADAKKMGVKELVSTYTTYFGGVPNRIHNVELVSHLIDGTLIAPGATFSFNGTTGDRNASKGFLEAPVIINGELTTGLGGGVCQVSTTVFNAAYEAGLNITARTNHALYISHYPQGRDATVDYPDVDLKFVNDTTAWLLLRTFVSSSSLTVNLYGTSPHRRVVSTTAPLVATGPPPTQWVKDPTLAKGQKVIEEAGSPPLATSVHRQVYATDGKLLYDNTWYSHYDGEKRVVHIGTKAPKPTGPTGATGPSGPSGPVGPTGPRA